jgi:hypothetical protein
MCAKDGYRGFVLGMFIAAVILGMGAIASPNGQAPMTSPLGAMIFEFVIAGLMAGMYMIFHDKGL